MRVRVAGRWDSVDDGGYKGWDFRVSKWMVQIKYQNTMGDADCTDN